MQTDCSVEQFGWDHSAIISQRLHHLLLQGDVVFGGAGIISIAQLMRERLAVLDRKSTV